MGQSHVPWECEGECKVLVNGEMNSSSICLSFRSVVGCAMSKGSGVSRTNILSPVSGLKAVFHEFNIHG